MHICLLRCNLLPVKSQVLTRQPEFYKFVHLCKQYSVKIGNVAITLETFLMLLPNQPPSPEAVTVLISITSKIGNLMYSLMRWLIKECLPLRPVAIMLSYCIASQ